MRKWMSICLLVPLLAGCGGFWSDRLPYAGPVETGIPLGEFLPGTNIQYLGKIDGEALVVIAGKQVSKGIGDSLDWKDDLVPRVSVDQTLRISAITDNLLHTVGTVRVIVSNPELQSEPANRTASVHFQLPVGYHVEKNRTIPGTTITYLGKTDETAHLRSVEGDTYRPVGDALTWQGRLRPGIWLELNMQIMLITDNLMDIVGTADLWITPVGE